LKICRKFFFNSEVSLLLDSITVINQYLGEHFPDSLSKHWLSRVNRIFTEEHLAYRVEEEGIVRPFVDEEFQVNRATALDALGDPKFGEARSEGGCVAVAPASDATSLASSPKWSARPPRTAAPRVVGGRSQLWLRETGRRRAAGHAGRGRSPNGLSDRSQSKPTRRWSPPCADRRRQGLRFYRANSTACSG
jgi:hypothetical protein